MSFSVHVIQPVRPIVLLVKALIQEEDLHAIALMTRNVGFVLLAPIGKRDLTCPA